MGRQHFLLYDRKPRNVALAFRGDTAGMSILINLHIYICWNSNLSYLFPSWCSVRGAHTTLLNMRIRRGWVSMAYGSWPAMTPFRYLPSDEAGYQFPWSRQLGKYLTFLLLLIRPRGWLAKVHQYTLSLIITIRHKIPSLIHLCSPNSWKGKDMRKTIAMNVKCQWWRDWGLKGPHLHKVRLSPRHLKGKIQYHLVNSTLLIL